MVKLGSILRESKVISENPDTNKRITVRLKVLGVEKRGVENEVSGATKQFIRKAGQFIFGKQNFHKGAFGIVPIELDGFESSSDLPAFDIDKSCLPEFLFYFFKQGNYYLELSKIAYGVATQRINLKEFYELKIPLPSIETQRLLIDRIKQIEEKGEKITTELSRQLNLVKQLRQSFLSEAMQGKLVPQNPADGNAKDLLEKIKAEKTKLLESKQIKKGKLQEAELLDDILFEIPKHWSWCSLDEISSNISDGTHQTPVYTKTGRIFLSAQNIKPFRFIPQEHKYVSEEDYQDYIKSKKAEKGDILIARVGAGIGEAAVINIEIDFCFYVSLCLVQPFKNFVDSEYLTYVINSPYGVKYAKGNISSKGGSAGNFNLGRIRSFLIPLPPLPEQQRIVEKLDELMRLCDELEQSIKASQGQNEKLLQQVLREALKG